MDDEPSEAAVADGSSSAVKPSSSDGGSGGSNVVAISPRGDVVLDVLFETSKETLRASRKAHAAGLLKPRLSMAFRVEAAALKKNSRYFANLLGDTRFQEARVVEAALAALALDQVKPADADASRLPRVHIEDDDEGSRTAGRELVFAELLRILHWDGAAVDVASRNDRNGGGGGGGGGSSGELDKPRGSQSNTAAAKVTAPSKSKPVKNTAVGKAATSAASSSRRGGATAKGARLEAAAQNPLPPHPPLLPGSRWSAQTPPTLLELAMLTLQADRFACTEATATYVRALRLRFPHPIVRGARGESGIGSGGGGLPGMANEEAIRQKVFVSWLLDQPIRFHTSTRELILYGSRQWVAALAGDDHDGVDESRNGHSEQGTLPAWWDLPDGLESELQFRRACIVQCIASVPRHFLARYTSRNRRQCKMGYESSAACDSFQLGEILKFLYHKDLLFLQDFSCTFSSSSSSASKHRNRHLHRISPADYAAVDIHHILAMLKQCPAYQLDKHHVNCGLRTRILPILEYIQSMLGAGVVALHRHEWTATQHGKASWLAAAEVAGLLDGDGYNGDDDDDSDYDADGMDSNGDAKVPLFGKPPRPSAVTDQYSPQVFRFTRSVAGDQRLRLEGSMATDRMARQLFTARRWNWTPEG